MSLKTLTQTGNVQSRNTIIGMLARQVKESTWHVISDVSWDKSNCYCKFEDSAPDASWLDGHDVYVCPPDKVGHWVVNGKPFCNTSYDSSIEDGEYVVQLTCACNHDAYLNMSKSLKAKYPDGSSKWVSWTAWYPTSCGAHYNDDNEYQIHTFTREYIDLSLLSEALRIVGGMDFSHEICMDNFDWPNVDGEESEHLAWIILHVSRYTMNPHGYHVGYENYQAALPITHARTTEINTRKKHPHHKFVVEVDAMETRLVEAPEEEECACVTGDCGCFDECVCTEDECRCELYAHPDEEFVWSEMDHLLREALAVPLCWEFDKDDQVWRIINHETDAPVWESK